jgi:ABC-type transporter Mla MlaB component
MRVSVKEAAIFPTWLALRRRLQEQLQQHHTVELDLSQTCLVDHTVMARLHELQADLASRHRRLHISGLDQHRPLSNHATAARKKSLTSRSLT